MYKSFPLSTHHTAFILQLPSSSLIHLPLLASLPYSNSDMHECCTVGHSPHNCLSTFGFGYGYVFVLCVKHFSPSVFRFFTT
ncbi:uncharacterized protein EI90DRAFT_3028429 [Cantharellus anzutake]|uniref:uncharacterized protein n=1 Tax=Cantharellus anzutake TaxID=1750568 RepID=UPI0019069C85|nr:uncharacterized protein EI90DRAFT_3028429 [Cantharellus anzutake]KAF8344145.1 hypothetical protein EI90DRAFT_3028429 [Cantharellus anzutake]